MSISLGTFFRTSFYIYFAGINYLRTSIDENGLLLFWQILWFHHHSSSQFASLLTKQMVSFYRTATSEALRIVALRVAFRRTSNLQIPYGFSLILSVIQYRKLADKYETIFPSLNLGLYSVNTTDNKVNW